MMPTHFRDLTALHQAAMENDAVTAERLTSAGADTEDQYESGGYTALHFAAEHQAVEAATTLLDAGAAVDSTDDWGNTPLWRAVVNSRGDGAMIALLRARGADPHHANRNGRTPLEAARMIGNYDVAQFFADMPGT